MTDWQALIKRVKNKQATPEEQALFEEKRAEYQAFQDYLLEDEWERIVEKPAMDLPEASFQKMKRATNRRIVIKILLVLLCLVGILGIGNYIGKKVMDRFYYNPTVTSLESELSDLAIYDLLYTELTRPEIEWNYSQTTPLSGGNYQIQNYYQEKYALNQTPSLQVTYQIKKGKVTYPNNYENPLLDVEHYPMFLYSDRQENAQMIETTKATTLNKVKQLPKSGSVFGFFTFKEALTTQEMLEFFGKFGGVNIRGLSVENQTLEDSQNNGDLHGLGMDLMHGISAQHGNKALMEMNKEYPELFPFAYLYSRPGFTAETYEQHYLSLLRYLIDHQELLSYIPDASVTIDELKQALAYVEKNGVKINGIYFSGSVDDFLYYAQKEEVLIMDVFEASLYRQGE